MIDFNVLVYFFNADGLIKKLEELQQNATLYKGKDFDVFYDLLTWVNGNYFWGYKELIL